ncbi:hypothetical protein, partial [Klebsiella pneumoniae]|uniref:hypothetical protein n=1 Tax=Klebsiella pneumoniae TaxID=573 RepID=UPI003EE24F92
IFTSSLPKTVYTLGEPIKMDFNVSYVGTERPEVVCLSGDVKITQGDQLIWQQSKSGGTGGGCLSITFSPG